MMMKSKMFMLVVILGFIAAAQGGEVSYVGADIDGGAAQWRTDSVVKPLDLDGDNLYGSTAAVQWGVAGVNEGEEGFWSYLSSGSQYKNEGYPDIDDVTANDGGATDVDGSIALSQFAFSINQSWETVRVGVMHDLLSEAEYEADFGWSVTLTQTGGDNTGAAATSEILPVGNGLVDIVFFDLIGVQAGDTFELTGVSNDGRAQNPYLGPVSWDAVPEPMSMLLMGLGGLGLIRKRK